MATYATITSSRPCPGACGQKIIYTSTVEVTGTVKISQDRSSAIAEATLIKLEMVHEQPVCIAWHKIKEEMQLDLTELQIRDKLFVAVCQRCHGKENIELGQRWCEPCTRILDEALKLTATGKETQH